MEGITKQFIDDIILISLEKKYFPIINKFLKNNFIPVDEARAVWTEIQRKYSLKNQLHTLNTLIQYFSDHPKNKSDVIEYLINLKQAKKPTEEQVQNTLDQFEEFIKQSSFVSFFNEMAETFSAGNTEQCYNMFQRKSLEFTNIKVRDVHSIERVFADFKSRHLERRMNVLSEEEAIQIPTGFDFLDESSFGGFYTKEIEAWLGDSGVGKSKLLVTRGINSARRGHNVLHIQLEGSKDQCLFNYDACWTGIEYKDFRLRSVIERNRLKRLFKLAETMLKTKKGEIFVESIEVFSSNVNFDHVESLLKRIEEEQNLKIDHVIIDYIELMSVSGKKYDYESGDIKKMIDLSREFKNFAIRNNVLGTTVFQSKTISYELLNDPKFVLTRSTIGKSTRVIDAFSYFLTINQTPVESRQKIVRIYEEKFREMSAKKTHRIKQNLARSRFYDKPSTMKMLEEEAMFDD